jgi:hypothetical protein
VPREQRGVESDALGVGLDDVGDRLGRQAAGDDAAFLDRAEYRAGRDAGGFEPGLQGSNRAGHASAHDGDGLPCAFLVGLAMPDGDLEAEFALLEILEVEGDELGAAEGAREADQQQGAVP